MRLPDCLVEEAVFESAAFGSETQHSPPRWRQAEEAVRWVGGACNPGGFVGEVGVGSVQKGGRRDTNGLLSLCCRVLPCIRGRFTMLMLQLKQAGSH